jgi:hypothetical protein
MVAPVTTSTFKEKRGESRTLTDRFYSVEISIRELIKIYQFKLRDVSHKGIGILVKDDSLILKYLNIGDIMKMRYHPQPRLGSPQMLKTQIKHVTKCDKGPFQGHHIVGLLIIEKLYE